MAAQIIEQEHLETDATNDLPVTASLTPDELVTEFSQPDTTSPEAPPEDDVPDKYRGKSIREVVSMHQEAEKLIGKHSSEVGELRGVVDGYIQNQLVAQSQPQPEPEPEVDFFEDPAKAVSRAIENHPSVQQAQQVAQESQQQASLAKLQQKHPDMQTVIGNPSFAEWVQSSPVRKELYQRADQQFDYNCADELISQFKERSNVAQQAQQVEQATRQQQVKAAQTGAGSGNGGSGAKRVYRRADIIKLMKTDPDRYEALSTEIMQAYAEGRVR